ncbi:MAG: ribosomal protein S18-alanine N-acetyltransferase [Pyrinomonadaceae bacterium]
MVKSDKIEICDATTSDAGSLRALAVSCRIDAWSVSDYAEEISRLDSIVVKALSEGRLVGFAVSRSVPGQAGGFEVDLYNLAVESDFRRKGTGGLILDRVVTAALKKGATDIWLEVRESNAAAISFYKRHGFVAEATRTNFYSNPRENAVIMRLSISSQRDNSGA